MDTGSFSNWDGAMFDLGPLYPFVGWEMAMVIALAIFWVGWHIGQMRAESRYLEEKSRKLREGDNLQRAAQAERLVERM
jgi:hypothetical protein